MQSSTDWTEYWNEGTRYLEIAERAFGHKASFTPEILYHMLGMSLEKMFMAWMGNAGKLPDNHTVRDLVRGAEQISALPELLRRDLIRFDRFMGLCSLIPLPMDPPTAADVPAMFETVRQTKTWIGERYACAN